MSDSVSLSLDGNAIELPLLVGTEGEKGLDISGLRGKTGYVTLDPAFMNTASTTSEIAFIDGEKGILRYRGYPIEQLAEKSTFVETSFLLIHGELPSPHELEQFRRRLAYHSMIHEDLKHFYDGFPATAHPMAILSAMVCSLSTFYPEALDPDNEDEIELNVTRLLSKLRTLAAYAYKKSVGQPFTYPDQHLLIDNSHSSPREVASQIVQHFDL